ncbi:hypothetical protein OQJ46_01385 [Microbulbifer thermotolerans]|uniref:DUF1232 domain-containing protein n=1 Tax=Microbulbifer thermotolerans TaxID=252514 RepID=A0AB35I0J2_MICTH|nr:DUF6116 family protein [Microbulbifer thermotolerans]MCX2781641.1 hypothetical protein [Microbulbifer thermotolerans]MCX2802292.1 hypothetical protein [Microbulbifer thermotolerans]
MKKALPSALVGWFLSYARKLEHPQLFRWVAAIFLVDLLIPDLLPFADEVLLGLATLYLGTRKNRRAQTPAKEKYDGTGKGERSTEESPADRRDTHRH